MNRYQPAANAAAVQQRMEQRREEAARYRMTREADQKERRTWWPGLWQAAAKPFAAFAQLTERRYLKLP